MKKKTIDEFKKELFKKNPNIELVGNYLGTHTNTIFYCKKCGNEWYAMPNNILRGHGCPICGRKRTVNARRKSNSFFLSQLSTIAPNIIPLEDYMAAKSKIKCKCKVCGHEWKATPSSLLQGHGCPKCGIENRNTDRKKTNEQFIAELKTVNPNIEPMEPYNNDRTKIKCLCKVCAYEWYATPNNLLGGRSCPKCASIKRANARKKKVICVETGIVYDSATDAAHCLGKKEGSHITSCCRRKKEKAFGYHWKYYI